MSYITDQQQNEKNDHIECRSYYVGPMTAKLAAKSVKPNHFIIYYQLPDDKNPIPYRLRLYLAYKGQSEEVFHFPIVCGTNQRTGDPSWSLRHADSATFPTLADMIKYHRTYAYMDPGTGKVETFPIWKNVLIDCDDID
uniref:Uncharacterized protein n=1 Tax=Panagrolaimus sp. JU765 TaxID=591449 RepID=A0AC34PZ70_9BILA